MNITYKLNKNKKYPLCPSSIVVRMCSILYIQYCIDKRLTLYCTALSPSALIKFSLSLLYPTHARPCSFGFNPTALLPLS